MNSKSPQIFRLKAAAVAIAACFATPVVWANPTGATVVNGSATFATNGNTLSITNTPGTILNWQQFSINQGQTTQFIQQSAQSSVLNRVVSNQPSQILGTLRSNGQVFLINQAGIMFGVGSVVDVNGLIASTLNISNADFLLNRLNFNGANGTSVLNQGSITTPLGGRVYLIGNNVTNEGVITTPQGNVVLAAGNSVSLVDSMTPHISVTVNAPAGGQAINLGQVNAQGGAIDIYAALIQQQGTLRADSASVNAQGNIVLSASQSATLAQGSVTSANGVTGGNVVVQSGSAGSTTVAGVVSATGEGAGGNIKILGKQVTLTDTAQIDASGATAGGTVLVGGDFQGKNAAVQNAFSTSVASGAVIKVDALVNGNGGKSVVWANDTTTFAGHISARGGAQGGNGGNVEVSGKRILAYTGLVNTLAPKGKAGSLLMDPASICIVDTLLTLTSCSVLRPVTVKDNAAVAGTWKIQTTGGDIVVVDPIMLSSVLGNITNVGKTLTLEALLGNVLTLSPTEAQTWKTAQGITTVTSLGGLILTYGANLVLNATNKDAAGVVTPATGGVHVANSILTDGGNFTIFAEGAASISGGSSFMLPGTTVSNAAGIYTYGGAVNVSATDFVLGWDQRTGMNLATPTSINTMGAAAATGPVLGGAVNIGSPAAFDPALAPLGVVAPTMNSVLLETGSKIFTGTGKIALSGASFSNPNGTSGGGLVYSHGQTILSFDRIDTSKLGIQAGSIVFRPFTSTKNVFLGLAGTDPRCVTDLCLFSNNLITGGFLWANNGIAVESLGNMTVAGNVNLDGGNNLYALVAANDITLNGALTVSTPSMSLVDPVTGLPIPFPVTNLALIAGNRVLNNVGAGALNVPVGHGWSLFAKDQTTSLLNGLSATSVVNMAQDPNVFPFASILPRLTMAGDPISLLATTAGNREVFWGSSAPVVPPVVVPPVVPPVGSVLLPVLGLWVELTPANIAGVAELNNALVNCGLNPASCSNTVANNSLNAAGKTIASSTSVLKSTTAVADILYSASMGIKGGLVWIAYDDIRRARHESRQADEDFERATLRLSGARGADERQSVVHEVESRSVWVSNKRAESRVRETEMELRAAEVELKEAKSPEELVRAEIRQTVAASRRADAEVKKASAEVQQAEVEIKQAKSPEAKAAAEMKKAEAETRKVQAEIRKTEVDVEKAETELKQAEAEVKVSATPHAKTTLDLKRAEVEGKRAEAELKKAEAEVKSAKEPAAKANAELKVAAAEAKKADAEAQKANVEAERADDDAQRAGTPDAQRHAEVKKGEAEAKQAHAEVKKAEVDVKAAKDSAARENAEEKLARAEERKADADVKVAEDKVSAKGTAVARAELATKKAIAEEKKAEVAVKAEKDGSKKVESEAKLADAQARKAEAEEKQATHEAKEARESAKSAHTPDDKYVALKKAEASEARAVAKNSEIAAKRAEADVKRVDAEVKQAEVEVKEAKSPAQRAEAERRLGEKRSEFESKRADAEQKGRHAEVLRSEADNKEGEYHAQSERRDEKVLASFGGVDVASMNPARVQELMSVRHEFLKAKLGSALQVLSKNPKVADLNECGTASGEVCIRPLTALANFAAEVVARIKLPFMTPSTAFIPEIERKIAVVIGNNAYQDPDIPSLNGAVKDADAVSKMLKEKMGYDVRLVHNATRADIVRTLNQVADETGSKDSVVVYYAGHGYQMEDTGVGYWIPSDGSTTNPSNWISNADINKMLTGIPAKQMLIVSDSCFSGTLTSEQQVVSSITSKESPADILGKRSVVIMSSGGEEPVMDEGRDGHSIFAWHLMDKLSKLNSYEHGAEVFDEIKAGVAQDGIPQVPQYGASRSAGHNAGGDYLFEVRKY